MVIFKYRNEWYVVSIAQFNSGWIDPDVVALYDTFDTMEG